MACGSPEHDPDENVLGWYVVPITIRSTRSA
jgi:hypothetical protein